MMIVTPVLVRESLVTATRSGNFFALFCSPQLLAGLLFLFLLLSAHARRHSELPTLCCSLQLSVPSPTLTCSNLPYPVLPTLSYPTLLLVTLIPYPTLPYPALPYPTLPYPALPCPALPYPTLRYPTLPYPTLPYPTLPYPTRTCINNVRCRRFRLVMNVFAPTIGQPACGAHERPQSTRSRQPLRGGWYAPLLPHVGHGCRREGGEPDCSRRQAEQVSKPR